MVKKEKIAYVESANYFSKEARKAGGLGEYAKKDTEKKLPAKKGRAKKEK